MQMGFKIIFIFLFVSVLTGEFAYAQQTPAKKDSTHLYKNIETYSGRSKFTKFVYRLLFKPVASSPPKKKTGKKVYKKLIQKPYSTFEGKTIRHINIQTLDPFGYSIGDTIIASLNFLTKTGNKLHIKSQVITIRNLLLIRQNQKFDSLLVKESERLVRSRSYVRDVSFFVKSIAKKSDSVDVFIRVLDIWSIIPRATLSSSRTSIGFTDQNFLGLGHEFQNDITRNYTEGNYSYHTSYSIPNLRNTYISTTLRYGIDGDRYFNKSLIIDRPFFSPFAKWAAGVNFTQQFRNDSIPSDNTLFVHQRYKYNLQDFWVGNAMLLLKSNTENNRTTNFISAARFLRIRYLEKPNEMVDPQHFFSDENFYIGSIGISTRKYVQDKFIFKYGITEDVPIGKVYNLTVGYQEKNNIGRLYLGGRISIGNYYQWGYLSSNIECGTFIRASNTEQAVLKVDVNYFTGLIEIGKWKFRQFVKPQLTVGINRLLVDSLTLNDGYGLDGFHSNALTGTSRLLFTLQTQSYAPWNFVGFHFGPYLTCTLGMLGDDLAGFKNSKVYAQIGVGVLIKNVNLVFNTFQLSISFYPSIPGKGQNVFKLNSFSTADFGLRDFEIGKPATVLFR